MKKGRHRRSPAWAWPCQVSGHGGDGMTAITSTEAGPHFGFHSAAGYNGDMQAYGERIMPQDPAEALLSPAFARELAHDDAAAARSHLDAGRAIYYADPSLGGAIIRQHPGGHREIIQVGGDGTIRVVREVG